MEESKRQKQVGKLVQQELSDIFQREGVNIIEGGMVSVSNVQVTPDLLEARIYLSFFQIPHPDKLLHDIKVRTKEWRGLLGARVKNQLRRVPELTFYNDETLDHVFKMDELFKKLEAEREAMKKNSPETSAETPNPSEGGEV